MAEQARRIGASLGVSGALHNHDQLLGYLINHARMEPSAAISAYFSGGRSDAHAVLRVADQLGLSLEDATVLEFASGYGRVTRHLKGLVPQSSNLIASDIHEDACGFIASEIGVKAEPSATSPAGLNISGNVNFLFALSLFSHLPERTFGPWLYALYDRVAPGGYLLFTTHGEFARHKVPEFFTENFDEAKGFGFRPESDQQDLDSTDYGTAVVSIPYVANAIYRHAPGSLIISMSSGTWFGIQDGWIIRKPA
jgi:SAM-dependent methyltransferase